MEDLGSTACGFELNLACQVSSIFRSETFQYYCISPDPEKQPDRTWKFDHSFVRSMRCFPKPITWFTGITNMNPVWGSFRSPMISSTTATILSTISWVSTTENRVRCCTSSFSNRSCRLGKSGYHLTAQPCEPVLTRCWPAFSILLANLPRHFRDHWRLSAYYPENHVFNHSLQPLVWKLFSIAWTCSWMAVLISPIGNLLARVISSAIFIVTLLLPVNVVLSL